MLLLRCFSTWASRLLHRSAIMAHKPIKTSEDTACNKNNKILQFAFVSFTASKYTPVYIIIYDRKVYLRFKHTALQRMGKFS